jgi:hypothetical protein
VERSAGAGLAGLEDSDLFRCLKGYTVLAPPADFSGVRLYEATGPDGPARLACFTVVSSEDRPLWEAYLELVKFSLATAQAAVRGHYEFKILSLNLSAKLEHFIPANLGALLVNHAQAMAAGESRLVRYTSLFAVFKKTLTADWGKIRLDTGVSVYPEGAEALGMLAGKIGRAVSEAPGPVLAVLNDLSRRGIFRPESEEQKKSLSSAFRRGRGFWKERAAGFFVLQEGRSAEVLKSQDPDAKS